MAECGIFNHRVHSDSKDVGYVQTTSGDDVIPLSPLPLTGNAAYQYPSNPRAKIPKAGYKREQESGAASNGAMNRNEDREIMPSLPPAKCPICLKKYMDATAVERCNQEANMFSKAWKSLMSICYDARADNSTQTNTKTPPIQRSCPFQWA